MIDGDGFNGADHHRQPSDNKAGDWFKDKQKVISTYKFTLAFENTQTPYYVTEKLCIIMMVMVMVMILVDGLDLLARYGIGGGECSKCVIVSSVMIWFRDSFFFQFTWASRRYTILHQITVPWFRSMTSSIHHTNHHLPCTFIIHHQSGCSQ